LLSITVPSMIPAAKWPTKMRSSSVEVTAKSTLMRVHFLGVNTRRLWNSMGREPKRNKMAQSESEPVMADELAKVRAKQHSWWQSVES
jgi:hypothetical protein